jgi:hypothetical protein
MLKSNLIGVVIAQSVAMPLASPTRHRRQLEQERIFLRVLDCRPRQPEL